MQGELSKFKRKIPKQQVYKWCLFKLNQFIAEKKDKILNYVKWVISVAQDLILNHHHHRSVYVNKFLSKWLINLIILAV